MKDLLSPKQVARAIGVSESSLKRWCDQGLIRTERTAGGHRRLPIDAVVKFLREQGFEVKHPDVLGLPASIGLTNWTTDRACERLTEALIQGDEDLCRGVVLDVYLAKHRLSTICDHVIGGAFQAIGDLWDCGDVEVFEERRACEICLCVLHELRRLVSLSGSSAPTAMGGTLAGDPYTLANSMVELVLRDSGWHATSLGSQLPLATLRVAVQKYRPRVLWLSVSAVLEASRLIDDVNQLFETAEAQKTALVLGGRALSQDIRRQIRYSCFCDTLEHLETFASTLNQRTSASDVSVNE